MLRITIQDNLTSDDESALMNDMSSHTWMALVGAPVAGFDTSREAFIGPYRSYHNPLAVEQGACTGSNAYGDNACGALQANLTLQPGESRELLVLLGIGDARVVGKRTLAEFGSLERAAAELEKLKHSWHAQLGSLTVETPDEELNHTVNVWGLYNCLITFAWSRAASLVYNGERDGLGFRDSVQDVLGVTAAIPDEARQRLELMLTGQLANGGAMPIVQPFDHHPGQRTRPQPGRIPLGRLPVVLQRRPGLRGRDRRPGFLPQGAALRRPGRGHRLGPPAPRAGIQPGTHAANTACPAAWPRTGTTACAWATTARACSSPSRCAWA